MWIIKESPSFVLLMPGSYVRAGMLMLPSHLYVCFTLRLCVCVVKMPIHSPASVPTHSHPLITQHSSCELKFSPEGDGVISNRYTSEPYSHKLNNYYKTYTTQSKTSISTFYAFVHFLRKVRFVQVEKALTKKNLWMRFFKSRVHSY